MKIFKKPFKKTNLGSSSSHDPGRSNEIPPPSSSSSSSPSPSPSALSPSCGSDHRAAAAAALAAPSTVESPRPAAAGDRSDYYSSEEEFQVQLALALSASNSDFRGDPDGDQIRAATLLSLGRQRLYQTGEEEGTAEWLSRRYWDYNVLDYNEKVVDGFYDIFGLSSDPASQGKMPALLDLQTGIGDLGFEVIVVNRAIDPSLVELEQIAQCISLDSPAPQVALLVQRVSELVTEHMGGPVRDANDMLTKWMEKSSELRTSLQTSLLPIGCIKVGLSRHRALLFKVLADNVGVPCRLVKGSHYTGVDDDAINIIKLDNEREFLVDLMAAPGTLIPADVLSAKDAPLGSYNPRLNNSLTPWATNNSGDGLLRMKPSWGEYKGNSGIFGTSAADDYNAMDKESRYEKAVLLPPVPIAHSRATSANAGSSSGGNRSMFRLDQANYSSSSASATSSKQKEVLEVPVDGDHSMNEKLNIPPNSQDPVDSKYLFAELNPFHAVGVGKTSAQFKASDNKNTEYQRRRENIPSGPGRPQLPLVWKNRSPCNEVPNTKQSNFGEELYPRKNVGVKDLNASSSSHPSSQAVKIHSECPNINVTGISSVSYSPGICTSGNEKNDTLTGNTGCPSSRVNSSSIDSGSSQDSNLDNGYALISTQPSEENNREENHTTEVKEQRKNVNGKHDMKKGTQDRFMKPNTISKDSESSTSQLQAMASRLDPMLDDVAEWEIPWEDLVIGERIGLGSYGEVYRADWNGTVAHGSSDSGIVTLSSHAHDEHSFQGISAKEVAVKKFLDQDFYGDALDEFRSEVRIMRRLRHPNVVLFMGAVTRPPNLSIVSEFLPRGSLYRILHRPNCQIDEKRRIKMALDVARGMNCLHASMPTIVHRDLKSPNLLVDKNWTVKVCDFGLSRLKHNTFLSSKSTAGTPEWMAPEVLRNEPSNEKCDVYSFGVILWELATLRMPWSGMNPMQVVGAVGFQDRRLDIPKEVDPIVARIIWECWQKDPSLRPSFAQLTTALKSLQRLAIPSHQETHSPPLTQEISVNSTP